MSEILPGCGGPVRTWDELRRDAARLSAADLDGMTRRDDLDAGTVAREERSRRQRRHAETLARLADVADVQPTELRAALQDLARDLLARELPDAVRVLTRGGRS